MPLAALEMVLAGSLSEEVILGHYLERGFEGDKRLWLNGVGAASSISATEFDRLAGEPLGKVIRRVQGHVRANSARIWSVVGALAGVNPPAEGEAVHELDLSRPHRLSEAEVIELIGRLDQ
jgi:hypothetical protein